MTETVFHYYPSAVVLFISGFRTDQFKNLTESALMASNVGMNREIVSLHIQRTIRNSPSTCSMTIVNNRQKFTRYVDVSRRSNVSNQSTLLNKDIEISQQLILPDNPQQEIQNLYNRTAPAKVYKWQTQTVYQSSSGSTKASTQTTVALPSFNVANYYPWKSYDDWKIWNEAILTDVVTQKSYAVSYSTDEKGKIREYWSLLDDGTIVKVPLDIVNPANSGQTFTLDTLSHDNRNYQRKFILTVYTNRQIMQMIKDTEWQGEDENVFNEGKCALQAMDRFVVFLSTRFDTNGNKNQSSQIRMIRVFSGVLNRVQQKWTPNMETIDVEGEDVTKFMRMSIVNVNPALPITFQNLPDQTSNEGITVWGDIFEGMRAPEIIRLLTLGGRGNNGNDILAIGEYAAEKGRGAKSTIFSVDANDYLPVALDQSAPSSSDFVVSTAAKRAKSFNVVSIRDILGDLFTKSTVHILDPFKDEAGIAGFTSYKLSLNGAYSFYQGDFKVRRDIAYKIAEDTDCLFYADGHGDIWFTPRDFSIARFLALNTEYKNAYVIDKESIYSYAFLEDDTNVYSSVYVDTVPPLGLAQAQSLGITRGAAKDYDVVFKYGQRIFTVSNPLLGDTLTHGFQGLTLYAKSLLQRLLAGRYQGQITIGMRAEIEPNSVIYVPIRNMFYFVETVDHDLDFGRSQSTTLYLTYGRKPWDLLPSRLSFSENDEIYKTDGSLQYPSNFKPQ